MAEQVQDLGAKLSQLQEIWDKAPVLDGGNVPEGDYEGEITDFDFFENRDGTELFLKTTVTARIPRDYDGVNLEVVNSLSHPERVRFAKELLSKLGLDVTSLSMGDLIPALRTVLGTGVAFRVVHNTKGDKTYQNVYINDVLFGPLQAAPESDVPPDTDGLPTPEGKKEFGF